MDHQVAELSVERAKRLVHQKALRPAHDGAAERHALPVAAGQPGHGLVEEVVYLSSRATSSTFRRISADGMPCASSGKPMFFLTFMCG